MIRCESMTLVYRTMEGKEYDLSHLSSEEEKLLDWLKLEFKEARSWIEFEAQTERGIVEASKKARRNNWREYFLMDIQTDMGAAIGVLKRELRGKRRELSDLFIEKP